ncbi:GTPase HflX [Holzapfeliella sp. JNUCC 80]
MLTNNIEKTKVVVAGVDAQKFNFDYAISELKELVFANNMTVVSTITQKLDNPVAGTYFGKGKLEELKQLCEHKDVQTVVLNDELTPTQIRNIEKITELKVIDRTELILEIFAQRAKTKQATLQVNLARLQYALPRLHPSENTLDQQRGGSGFANRGAGETKLEINRRTIQKEITRIKRQLEEIEQTTLTQRKERQKSDLPKVALVGYTNAGKSSTMNALIKAFTKNQEDKAVFEKDMLFATLDTSVRHIRLPHHREFILSDTVGFVSRLPHNLVEAFKATLLEAKEADLIVQVVDYSDPNYREMMATTAEVLKEIGADKIPMILAFNKADKTDTPYPQINSDEIIYSAIEKPSILQFSEFIQKQIFKDYETVDLIIPATDGKTLSYLQGKTEIISQEIKEADFYIKAVINPNDKIWLKDYLK